MINDFFGAIMEDDGNLMDDGSVMEQWAKLQATMDGTLSRDTSLISQNGDVFRVWRQVLHQQDLFSFPDSREVQFSDHEKMLWWFCNRQNLRFQNLLMHKHHRRHEGNLFGAEIQHISLSWNILGNYKSLPKALLKIIFPFPRVGYESFLRAGLLKYGESVDFYWYAHSVKLT